MPGAAFAGQDAQYDGLQPNYQDNGDGTITDLNTGLMWMQDFTSDISLADAITAAAAHEHAGYDDWRLPTLKELYSLILFTGETGTDATDAVPYLDTDVFSFEYGDTDSGARYIDAQYLSTTEYIHTTMNGDATVFGVNFADGRIKGYPIYQPSSNGTTPNTYYARYVRGNTSYGINDFIDNGDGTAAINTTYFKVTEIESFYWSSTTHLDGAPESVGNYAVYLSFGRALGWINENLLDVHGAGAQRSDPKSGTPVLESPGHGPQGDVLRIYNAVRCVRSAATPQGIDSDGDGLADWYEYNHSGSATDMLAHADSDGDGLDNLDESRAGTSPTDPSAQFIITQTETSNEGLELTWQSELGQTYRITYSDDLINDGFTQTLKSNIAATPPLNQFTVPTDSTHTFYRIEVE